jgi:hypothetical protein
MAVGEGCCRMAHRTVRCATRHCPVRQPRHPTVRVRPLELLTSGPPDSPVVHRTLTVHCPVRHLTPVLTLRAQSTLFTVHCSRCRRPLVRVAVAPLGTPDSPVNYSGVAPQIPEGGKFGVELPWCIEHCPVVHRTLSGGTSDSPVCQTRAAFGCLLLFLFEPFLGFLLVCVEPLAPVELII